ncbi:site-specific integrase [Candidatus Woesearchaeota archaeon]|nr:site-specific integrase [Candidatus Woesearchaeota archaeon]
MADTNRIYCGRGLMYVRQMERLASSMLSLRNKEILHDYRSFLLAKGVGELRVSKLLSQMQRLAESLPIDLDKVQQRELQELVANFNSKPEYSDETKADYRRCIKQFYAWFEDNDARLANPETRETAQKVYRYLKTQVSRTCRLKKVDFSNIITEDDLNRVIGHCRNIREKAFLKLLHEAGCRVGEFLNIRLKDIQIMKNRALIIVDGKTGERRIPVVNSLPFLVQALEVHPFSREPDRYLWLGESRSNLYEPLMHRGAQKLIDRCFERAGVNKKHNFHWFRHSRATLLAPRITESLLCKYMGWTLGSQQVRRYVHLCTEQLESAVLEMNGLKDHEEQKSEQPKVCVCGTLNEGQARYCYRCGNPLSMDIVIQDQEVLKQETDDRLKVYAEIMANPEKRRQFEEFKAIFFKKTTEAKPLLKNED